MRVMKMNGCKITEGQATINGVLRVVYIVTNKSKNTANIFTDIDTVYQFIENYKL